MTGQLLQIERGLIGSQPVIAPLGQAQRGRRQIDFCTKFRESARVLAEPSSFAPEIRWSQKSLNVGCVPLHRSKLGGDHK
jgi:hypothetical protein